MRKTRKKLLTASCLTLSMLLSAFTNGVAVKAATVSVGLGSYTDTAPSGLALPPSTIYKTSNLTGAIPTTSWESSVLWTQYSEPMFAHPLSYKASSSGLEVGRPVGGGGGIAYFYGHTVDYKMQMSNATTFADAKAEKVTDWTTDIVMANGANNFKATLVKGSPYTYYTFTGGNPRLVFNSTPTVFYGNSGTQYLGITVNGKNYGLFAPAGATWSGIGTSTITCNLPAGKTYFSTAVLPDSSSAAFSYFQARAYAFVTDTKVSWTFNEAASVLTTTFTFTTTAKEGSNLDTIIALYPHQWRNNTAISPLTYTYPSIRGQMKTISGRSFTTTYNYNGILPNLPDNGTYNKATLNSYVEEVKNEPNPLSATDTYWNGKQLGKIAQILPIAEQVGNTSAATYFLNLLKSNLENWFKYNAGEGSRYFYRNDQWGTLIGVEPSYGTNDQINDHHFHYGYFINAAAHIALRDKTWASSSNWGGMVNLLIKDIANWDRNDTAYPFLRGFDPYEGHSWASGHSLFADGNNQESSSEAINAWQSIILWGEATGNKTIRDLGIYLYTTEVQAINNYWFDIYNDIFHPSYGHEYASMVWGGKYTHEIWWAGTAAEVHGINFLPITGGSLYLGTDPNYVKKNYDELYREMGNAEPDKWQDIIYSYLALYDPALALSKWNGNISPEAGETKAHTCHWIHNLNGMGTPDFTVRANTALYAVFKKGTTKTYVAYNPANTAKTVTFTDGYVLNVPANSMATSNGSTTPPVNNYTTIPGKIEAENYNAMSGVQTESCVEGGLNVGWIDTGDWMDYNINVPTAGTYTVSYRVASTSAAGSIQLRNGAAVLATTVVPNTGDWQAWTTVTATVNLTVGNQTLRLYAASGGFNVNWIQFDAGSNNGGGQSGDFNYSFAKQSSSTARITFTPTYGTSSYVILHYIVNNGTQLNVYMTSSGSSWIYDITGLSSGATVKYQFTYVKGGAQYDSAWYTNTF
ncbi:glycosyl hydrolase [Clostridium thermarum]|uniref:glycosyl hydrolase n=1 Tax=Clostridium thermarum TaxID=1716543 RepID=UPI0013D6C13E|nr:glycosyl hydrolase [Clostridium thermarum]